jgi:hypothetical protein
VLKELAKPSSERKIKVTLADLIEWLLKFLNSTNKSITTLEVMSKVFLKTLMPYIMMQLMRAYLNIRRHYLKLSLVVSIEFYLLLLKYSRNSRIK